MPRRPPDSLSIESVQGGDFSIILDDRANGIEIVNDLREPSSTRFELGDDGTFSALRDAVQTGTRFRVLVNQRPRMQGRLLAKSMPVSDRAGATVQVTVRTVLADASYANVSPKINVRKATLADIVYQAYEPFGLTPDDFTLQADLARDIMTGKGGSSTPPVDLAAIKEDQAAAHPGETVRAFVERHLNRFHYTQWDAPSGGIVIGAPDDSQEPLYNFRCFRGLEGRANNITGAERIEDFEDAPSILGVFGTGGGREFAKAKVRSVVEEPTLAAVDPPLYRPVLITDDAVSTQAQADARSRRELALRRLATDAWRIETDGWSHWDGETATLYAVDTVGDVHHELAGGASGAYLLYRTALRGDDQGGYTAELEMAARGLWQL